MASSQVAIIIPAFNEAASIGGVITELLDIVGPEITIVVVNDSSSDNTGATARKAGALVVDLKMNHGYAEAINQGLAYASSDLDVNYLLTMDADGQHDPYSVKKIIQSMLTDDVDLIVGQRAESARFSEWLYGQYFSKKFNITDPLCGLKVYKKHLYDEYGAFETYDSIGTELLTWALLKGFKIKQLPVNIRSRQDEPRFGSLWLANKRIFISLVKTIKYIQINKP
ncbi:glycosyltransferase family 2 protein [Shewanella polaris]|uniref:Glycosyltransferase family 2 protein n=1 Tax=Shewanella polaris TaxID=2588449 RepID=A0A4Y5YCT0_9GAMM|nr:glycosyltransferase family 2 protein [Shewanella polaris]QDE30505.1 glycosyltransferase family 2 protein [Shewanella polaris]